MKPFNINCIIPVQKRNAMYFSKHNIFSKIKDSDSYYIVNLLTGNADILDQAKANEIISGKFTQTEEYQAKGYLADEQSEKKLYTEKYLDFIETRDNDEVQIFFMQLLLPG
jgi:hypothetical protein